MKKYEVKGWVMVFLFLFTLLWMVSCRSVDKTTHKGKEQTELSIFDKVNLDNQVDTSVSSSELEIQRQMFSDLLSSLNIGYAGQNENDKLLFEMKRTIDGLNFQVSGTGTANYQQTESFNIEEFKTELYKQQDSLFKQALNSFFIQNKSYLNERFSQEKEVKVKGFTFGTYLIFGVIAIIAFVLGWIVRRINFKNLLKAV